MGESEEGVWGSVSEPHRPMEMKPGVALKKRWSKRSNLDDRDFMNFLHGSDPVKAELNRLQNELKELPSLEAILHPLEAEIKLLKQELTKFQDDNRALERLTKSKEAALLDADREVKFANIKAALVDDLQNKNQELMKQNDICQVKMISSET